MLVYRLWIGQAIRKLAHPFCWYPDPIFSPGTSINRGLYPLSTLRALHWESLDNFKILLFFPDTAHVMLASNDKSIHITPTLANPKPSQCSQTTPYKGTLQKPTPIHTRARRYRQCLCTASLHWKLRIPKHPAIYPYIHTSIHPSHYPSQSSQPPLQTQ